MWLITFWLLFAFVWVLCRIRLRQVDKHYQQNISAPWAEAIERYDWAACKNFEARAKVFLKNFYTYCLPWGWLKRLP